MLRELVILELSIFGVQLKMVQVMRLHINFMDLIFLGGNNLKAENYIMQGQFGLFEN